jgi:hypothetical protein
LNWFCCLYVSSPASGLVRTAVDASFLYYLNTYSSFCTTHNDDDDDASLLLFLSIVMEMDATDVIMFLSRLLLPLCVSVCVCVCASSAEGLTHRR